MQTRWTQLLSAAGLSLATLVGSAHAQRPGQQPNQPAPGQTPRTTSRPLPGQAPAATTAPRAQPGTAAPRPGDTILPGPIDNPRDIQETAKMLFVLTDTDHNRRISQKEAIDAGNLLVGGFFFRADQNGDGTLTRAEAQQARDQLLKQQPLLRFILTRTKQAQQESQQQPQNTPTSNPTPTQAARQIGNMLDGNDDRQIQATELRQAVQVVVESLWAVGDRDGDSELSPAELNEAAYTVARETMQSAIQAADADKNGALSDDEFVQAIAEPANIAFQILDKDLNGLLTIEEIDSAMRIVGSHLGATRIPTPSNAPSRVLGTPAAPSGR
jgi:Ca2+-binding EF-hand superfamily protein